MNDAAAQKEQTWLARLAATITGEPTSKSDLIELLRALEQKGIIDREALDMIERALTVSNMQVREIMVPRPKVVSINVSESPEEFLPRIVECGHSRFPVTGEDADDVIGILLAKDLLPLALPANGRRKFSMRDLLRPVTRVPESKRVNVLLQEFRENRNHLALVCDEHGGVAGIVTIEDVLEQIVGEIEDEYDFDPDDFIKQHADGGYIVKALTPLEDFNEHFAAAIACADVETVGGLVVKHFGHLPKRDECIGIDGFNFKVLNSDSRRIHLLQLTVTGAQPERAD